MSSRRSSLDERLSSHFIASVAAESTQDEIPPSRSSEVSSKSAASQMSDAADLKAATRTELLNLLTTMGVCNRPDTWTILVDLRTMFEPVRLMNFLLARYATVRDCSYDADNDTFVVDDPHALSDSYVLPAVGDRLVIFNGRSEDLMVKAAVLLFVDRWVEWFPLDFLPYSEIGFKLLRRVLKLLQMVLEEDFATIITEEVFQHAYPQLQAMLAPLTAPPDANQPNGDSVPSINTAESRDLTVEAAHKAVVNYLHQLHGLRFNCTVDPSFVDVVDCTPAERKLAYVLFTSVKKSMETLFEWYNDVALSLVIAECSAGDGSLVPPTAEECRLNTRFDQLLFARRGHTVQRLYQFARMVPIQQPTANTKRSIPSTSRSSRLTLSRKLGLSRESSVIEDGKSSAKAQTLNDIDAWDVAQQLTVRLHYLYVTVPCDQMLYDLHTSPELTRFRAESERLQSVFVNHILSCMEAKDRADRIVHLMDVVDSLFELRSFHAIMLIIMALQSTPIHRLKHTWAIVEAEHPHRWENLHRSVGLGGQHLVSRANELLTNDPACKLEIECPRQTAVNASLQPLHPTLSRQVTEELLTRPTDFGDEDDDSDEDSDEFDDGDTFSNSALQKVAREVLLRAESSRLDVLKPAREPKRTEVTAEIKRAARVEKLKALVAEANIVATPISPRSMPTSSSMDSLLDASSDGPSGQATPVLQRGSSTPPTGSGGIAMRRSPLLDRLRSISQSPNPASSSSAAGKAHQFFPSTGQSMPARQAQAQVQTRTPAKPPRAEPPLPPRRRAPHVPKVPPPMIPAYSFPIPTMPYIYGYTRMLMQFKELPAYVSPDPDDPDASVEELNVTRLRKISSIVAMLKSCQLTPYQCKATPEIQQMFEKSPKWVDEDSQWIRSTELEPLSTPSANA